MRFYRPWFLLRCLYPEAIFRIRTSNRHFCLTFDDGPDPLSTPLILDILDSHQIKAIFFCDGKAAADHPHQMEEIKKRGHIIGNHGFDHPDGWKTSLVTFCNNIDSASELTSGELFRPPFGHLTIRQYMRLRRSFRIIFWDIMPYDFDEKMSVERSVAILQKKLRPGSVIVLHDSPRSSAVQILPRFLDFSSGIGFVPVIL
jgi:peptidoglycan/xylan/chitin deacetylase (PgdA/CDA1 family)